MSAGRLCVLVILMLAAFPIQALDTQIKVLIVLAPGGQQDDQQTTQIDGLVSAHSNVSGSVTTLSIVNAKNAFGNYIKPTLVGPALSGTSYQTTYNDLTGSSYNLDALRDANEADLVMIITPGAAMGGSVCGFAPQWLWTSYQGGNGSFQRGTASAGRDPIAGLDLRSSESAFVALLSDYPSCVNLETAYGDDARLFVAHEAGHLFGGGHDLLPSAPGTPAPGPSGWYLLSDSHSTVVEFTFFGLTFRLKQAIARTDSNIDKCVQNSCAQSFSYSASSGTNNVKTIQLTELSIANYRPIPQPPPPCGLTKPTYVNGFVTVSCGLKLPEDIYATEHYIYWGDSCPTASDYYVIAPVPTNPQVYEYTVLQSTRFWANFNTWHYVSSCAYGEGCTDWASDTYYAPFLCGF